MKTASSVRVVIVLVVAGFALGCIGPSADPLSSTTAPSQAASGPGPRPASEVKVEGIAAGLGGTCPNLSFMVGGDRVVTDANTEFKQVACATLRNGARVEVEGSRRSDQALLAREVEQEAPPPGAPAPAPPAPAPPGARIEIEGVITGLTGTCPNLSFSVGGRAVGTNSQTDFERITCAAIANGIEVEVKGSVQANGTIVAQEVEPRENFRVTSDIAGLTGSCPNISFMFGSERIVTTSATRFDDMSCGTLRNGLRVEVRGVRRPDGSILAARVRARSNG